VPELPVAVLASGSGSNLQAILDRLHGRGAVRVVGVGSDKPGARALERAGEAGVPTATFPASGHADREARDAALGDWLEEIGAELVVLAGYMQLLSPGLVRRFARRLINVHPALLPSFPGLHAIEQAIAHGVRVTGVTIHFVDEGVDTGPIILQEPIALAYTRPIEEVVEEIHRVEHELLPRAVELIARGAITIDDENPRLVRIDGS
jgi:phosphoribosylglycinamide formyltransferase-1